MIAWLPRHDDIVKQLFVLQENGRFPHAFLFRGPEGVGKREVARKFAERSLQAHMRAQDMFGAMAVASESKEYPDLVWIEPEEGVIKVEQVRELGRTLSYAPLESEFRYVIIVEADKLNLQAANAILKVLEEPPLHTRFLLTARDRSLVLPTIASRCQDFRFAPLSAAELQQVLGKETLALASEGSLGRLTELRLQEEEKLWSEPARLLFLAWQSRKIPGEVFKLLENLEGKDTALAILESWQALGRDVSLSLALAEGERTWYQPELASAINAWVQNLGPETILPWRDLAFSVASVCTEARVQLQFHTNPRLVLDSALAKLTRIP